MPRVAFPFSSLAVRMQAQLGRNPHPSTWGQPVQTCSLPWFLTILGFPLDLTMNSQCLHIAVTSSRSQSFWQCLSMSSYTSRRNLPLLNQFVALFFHPTSLLVDFRLLTLILKGTVHRIIAVHQLNGRFKSKHELFDVLLRRWYICNPFLCAQNC